MIGWLKAEFKSAMQPSVLDTTKETCTECGKEGSVRHWMEGAVTHEEGCPIARMEG